MFVFVYVCVCDQATYMYTVLYSEYMFLHVYVSVWGVCLTGSHSTPYPPPRIVRPIFDWTEVGDHFPRATPPWDNSPLAQVSGLAAGTE